MGKTMNDTNFFVTKIVEYYAHGGKIIPPEVLFVLAKPLASLNQEEADIYNQFIGPVQDKIRAALLDSYQQLGSPRQEWSQQVNPYYRPIVEEMAAQVLGIDSSVTLPITIEVRVPYERPEAKRESFLQRLSIPHISYKWAIAIVVIIAMIAVGGWLYYSLTAPSRLLNKIEQEIESGNYSAALQHIEEMREKYPDKEQTEKAEKLEPRAAVGYANELLELGNYKDSIAYYELASDDNELEQQALEGRFNAYAGWAKELIDNGDAANSYECCESALACAPEGYDTTGIMDLRAQALFSWGELLRNQQDYLGASERYEKCYVEWPAGSLAGKALENYIDMSVAFHCGCAPPSKSVSTAGNVQINLANPTDYVWKCFFSGPSTICIDLAPHETKTIYILPGTYNQAFAIEDLKVSYYSVGVDFSQPTGSYSWWDAPMPFPEDIATQGIVYEQIMARIDELKPSLPTEILECVERLKYQPSSSSEMSDFMGEYDSSDRTIYFNTGFISTDDLDATIFHEWGHAYSDYYLDQEEQEEYRDIREILNNIPWMDRDNFYLCPEEDFAEVFAVVFGGVEWEGYTWYGPVVNAEELKSFILTAAD
jgi:tetratricopeptide (TPR) repeat protein